MLYKVCNKTASDSPDSPAGVSAADGHIPETHHLRPKPSPSCNYPKSMSSPVNQLNGTRPETRCAGLGTAALRRHNSWCHVDYDSVFKPRFGRSELRTQEWKIPLANKSLEKLTERTVAGDAIPILRTATFRVIAVRGRVLWAGRRTFGFMTHGTPDICALFYHVMNFDRGSASWSGPGDPGPPTRDEVREIPIFRHLEFSQEGST
ncbi:hypothetical protein B0T20DRAFT_392119 [Sordaria brevicollis]|uniref:Uncharacterized protein n=1 Tax=Sordaria brevicollis TaxID=83679 RepID=A0AAE0UCJ2_SORBR|nr:hypothetical protein B0T20DRAFT_392119 [Sordaria brevicollis]